MNATRACTESCLCVCTCAGRNHFASHADPELDSLRTRLQERGWSDVVSKDDKYSMASGLLLGVRCSVVNGASDGKPVLSSQVARASCSCSTSHWSDSHCTLLPNVNV